MLCCCYFSIACFSPAQGAVTVGPSGDEPTPDDPFTLKLMMKQNLFTSGVLTLAPISEKPLQKVLSTAVVLISLFSAVVFVCVNVLLKNINLILTFDFPIIQPDQHTVGLTGCNACNPRLGGDNLCSNIP